MAEPSTNLLISADEEDMRLDRVLRQHCPQALLSQIHASIRQGEIKVNNERAQAPTRVHGGDILRLPPWLRAHWLAAPQIEKRPTKLSLPSAMNLPMLYEDDDLIVVDKPSGMACHGGSGVSWGLIETLRHHHNNAKIELVHRLDRETSGVVVIARSRQALRPLMAQFREGLVAKEYRAIVHGALAKPTMEINQALYKFENEQRVHKVIVSPRGKASQTTINRLAVFANETLALSYLQLLPQTGRTHQLRVHCAHIGHAILGDARYADFAQNRKVFSQLTRRINLSQKIWQRMYLHAYKIHIRHPISGVLLKLSAPLPQCFEKLIELIGVFNKERDDGNI